MSKNVNDLLAENAELRTRIAELEGEIGRVGCEACPKECEYPPGWTAGLEEGIARMSARIVQLTEEVKVWRDRCRELSRTAP